MLEAEDDEKTDRHLKESKAFPVSDQSRSDLHYVYITSMLLHTLLNRWKQDGGETLTSLVFNLPLVSRLWAALAAAAALQPQLFSLPGYALPSLSSNASASASSSLASFSSPFGFSSSSSSSPFSSSTSWPSSASSSSLSSSSSTPSDSSSLYSVGSLPGDLCVLLLFFSSAYSHVLFIQDDQEFFGEATLSLSQVRRLISLLRAVLYRLFWTEFQHTPLSQRLRSTLATLFSMLRDRQARKPFCSAKLWLLHADVLPSEQFAAELRSYSSSTSPFDGDYRMSHNASPLAPSSSTSGERAAALLSELPFCLPFSDRVALFYDFVKEDKQNFYQQSAANMRGGRVPWLEEDEDFGWNQPSITVKIRRDRVLEDGFDKLYELKQQLKKRVRVEFVDSQGVPEAGVDGGGLFKEFLLSLSSSAFNPSYGLFSETDEEHMLYPNPDSAAVDPGHHLMYFEFIGQIIGKAMYDGVLVAPQFANFFLRLVGGRYNYVDDMASLDPVVYRHLLFLKSYQGDFASLALTFSVNNLVFGKPTTHDLLPNGRNVAVTRANRMRFIYLLADYRLNKQIKQQAAAFLRGMHHVIKPAWLRMFTPDELRLLISGTPQLNVSQWKAHTLYSAGYAASHEVIRWFWELVDEFSEDDRSALLRFSTSSSRAPLLGFQALDPQFCIQRVDARTARDEENLPTSATCFNLLRIPRYRTKAKLKEKLLYAIHSGAGFGLT